MHQIEKIILINYIDNKSTRRPSCLVLALHSHYLCVKVLLLSCSHVAISLGAVAAYNFGTGNVVTWGNLDVGTTGNDYSNDVMARAKYLHSHGWN